MPGIAFGRLHQRKQRQPGEAQFEDKRQRQAVCRQFACHQRIDKNSRQRGQRRDQGIGPEGDGGQSVGVVLDIVRKERNEPGKNQKVDTAAGYAPFNRLKGGGVPDVFEQQRAPEPAGEQEGDRRGGGGSNQREQRAEPWAKDNAADEHQHAAGQQAYRGEYKQSDIGDVAKRAALAYLFLQVAEVGDQVSEVEGVDQDSEQADDSDNEQELSGCVVVTSFAWGSSCREEKVRATVL